MKKILKIFFLFLVLPAFSQQNQDSLKRDKFKKSGFKEYYPIHEKPSISYLSDLGVQEYILFDAKPVVNYSIYNDMRFKMDSFLYKPSFAIYLTYQPHIRMYQQTSRPVKTPSYKLLLGYQSLIKTRSDNFFAYAIESGHYSNGQAGCAFDENLEDGSTACENVYSTITDDTDLSDILNRKSGNFSTNQTKLSASFRFNKFSLSSDAPIKSFEFSASWTYFHNHLLGLADIGGFSKSDIDIYGRSRIGMGFEFMHNFKNWVRYSIVIRSEHITGAHSSVRPSRWEARLNIYPLNKEMGFFISGITGHDNYNYRFVDNGSQINLGFTWDLFAPFEIKRSEKLKQKRLPFKEENEADIRTNF